MAKVQRTDQDILVELENRAGESTESRQKIRYLTRVIYMAKRRGINLCDEFQSEPRRYQRTLNNIARGLNLDSHRYSTEELAKIEDIFGKLTDILSGTRYASIMETRRALACTTRERKQEVHRLIKEWHNPHAA